MSTQKHTYISVHSSIIHNSPKLETTMYINRWMENVVHSYNGVVFGSKRSEVLVSLVKGFLPPYKTEIKRGGETDSKEEVY